MATSSDAGGTCNFATPFSGGDGLILTLGNIPRFVTNASLPSSISEDVPSFLKWMVQRFPA